MEVLLDALAGSWGSMIAGAAVHPLDVAKYRVQAADLRGYYFVHVLDAIRDDGFSIYRGLLLSLVRTALVNFGGCKFGQCMHTPYTCFRTLCIARCSILLLVRRPQEHSMVYSRLLRNRAGAIAWYYSRCSDAAHDATDRSSLGENLY